MPKPPEAGAHRGLPRSCISTSAYIETQAFVVPMALQRLEGRHDVEPDAHVGP
jgi:hypothetical protein